MKVLVGFDGSNESKAMIRDLVNAGLPPDVDALVIQMVTPWVHYAAAQATLEGGVSWPSQAAMKQYEMVIADQLEAARNSAAEAVDMLKERFPGWKVKAVAELDNPAGGILAKEQVWKPDLIVLGAHGRSAVGHFLMGSVSQKVLHHARTNVRISRKGRTARGPQRVLVGVDGSKGSDMALREAAARRWPKGTEIRVIWAVAGKDFDAPLFDGSAVDISKFLKGQPSEWLSEKVARTAESLRSRGILLNTSVKAGDPRRLLLEEARKWKATGLFLGSRGLTGIKRFFLGGVSSAVAVHAPCSVEIVRK